MMRIISKTYANFCSPVSVIAFYPLLILRLMWGQLPPFSSAYGLMLTVGTTFAAKFAAVTRLNNLNHEQHHNREIEGRL